MKVVTTILCWLLVAGVVAGGSVYAYMLGEVLFGQGALMALVVLLALPAAATAVETHRLLAWLGRSGRGTPPLT